MAHEDAQGSIERITSGSQMLVMLIRASYAPSRTEFPTPDALQLQVGCVVYPQGGEVPRHYHHPVERTVRGTSEVIIVRSGSCVIDVYGEDLSLVASRELREGDVAIMIAGGHGFRMLEDCVLLEVKQGPYTGLQEKQRF